MKRNLTKYDIRKDSEKVYENIDERGKNNKKDDPSFDKQGSKSGARRLKNGKAKQRWNLLKNMLLAFRLKGHKSQKVSVCVTVSVCPLCVFV